MKTFARIRHSYHVLYRLEWHLQRNSTEFYLVVYSGIIGANLFFALFRSFLFAYGGICAARRIHRRLFSSILKVQTCKVSESCSDMIILM